MNAPNIILAGGSGFLGQALASFLTQHSYTPIILTRGPSQPATATSPQFIHWDATTGDWPKSLNNAHALINLVGRTVNCRKTPENKKEILDSRLLATRALAQAWQGATNPPKCWVQTSTAHIFGDTDDQILDESSPTGAGFAPDVGRAWEKEFNDADLADTRRVIQRLDQQLARSASEQTRLSAVLQRPENAEVLERSLFLNSLLYWKGISWTKVFADLEKALPPNVRIMNIRPQVVSENHVYLEMMVGAESQVPVVDLLKRLGSSEVFSSPTVYSSMPPSQTEHLYRYRVSVNYAQKL